MTVFLDKRSNRWRYQFKLQHQSYSKTGFETKREAQREEARRKEAVRSPVLPVGQGVNPTPTDMAFLDLVNRWLDFLKTRRSERHYLENCYMARRWIQCWGELKCSQVTRDMVDAFLIERNQVSGATANKDLRALKSLFNFGIKRDWLERNPTKGLEWFPYDKKIKRVPVLSDIELVYGEADQDTKDYLLAITDTMARVGEVNRLCWNDVTLGTGNFTSAQERKRAGTLRRGRYQ